MKHQSGFTLIELIMVIVILGILAATAMPKFADLRGDANVAALEGLRGAMDSAIAIAHGTQLTKSLASNVTVSMGGNAVAMLYGYPQSGPTGIMAALDLSGSKYRWAGCDAAGVCSVSGVIVPSPLDPVYGAIAVSMAADATTPSTCYVPYYAALVTGEKASTGNAVTTGC